jgi:membrane-associated phospholipid phosphatase
MDWTRKHIGVERVRLLVKLLTVLPAVCYGGLILWLLIHRDSRVIPVVLFPAGGFVAITILRKAIGARRPYEVYAFTPLLDKDSRRNSYPSRHVFSNMIIAVVVFRIWRGVGVLLMFSALLLAVLRVITGVHFPRDVIGGALFGIVLGLVGMI